MHLFVDKKRRYQLVGLASVIIIILFILFFTNTNKNKRLTANSHSVLLHLIKKVDSLQEKVDSYKLYVKGISNILSDNVTSSYDSLSKKDLLIPIVSHVLNKDSLAPSKKDLNFRKEVINDNFKTSIGDNKEEQTEKIVLFPPVKGIITSHYNIKEDHLAVDIACEEGTPVKSTMAGTVIFSDWTAESGYVLVIQHRENILSVYKHNSKLYKTRGSMVKAGEVVAAVGSSGELSTGPHLHFELWINGYAVDPENFIDF